MLIRAMTYVKAGMELRGGGRRVKEKGGGEGDERRSGGIGKEEG